jgi:hypothetical protein
LLLGCEKRLLLVDSTVSLMADAKHILFLDIGAWEQTGAIPWHQLTIGNDTPAKPLVIDCGQLLFRRHALAFFVDNDCIPRPETKIIRLLDHQRDTFDLVNHLPFRRNPKGPELESREGPSEAAAMARQPTGYASMASGIGTTAGEVEEKRVPVD